MDTFTTAYIQCALWSSTDDDDNPLEDNYLPSDLHVETRTKMDADCAKFQLEQMDWLTAEHFTGNGDYLSHAGHDFWLTRNHHGAGFWDGDWTTVAGKKLTEAAHQFGETHLYVSDDGEMYIT